jgi:hypothetical protein
MRTFDRFLYFDRQGDVSEAPDLDAILPILGGEDAANSQTARLKLLTVRPPEPIRAASAPPRAGRRERRR